MFTSSADYYDLIYGKKDYRGETDRLRELFRQFVPHGRTILDIACGTAEHLRFLPEYEVAGIDLEPAFVRMASDREGDLAILIGHYLIAEGTNVRCAVERHELLLLDRDQLQEFFRDAELTAEYLPEAFSPRGLYVVRPRSQGASCS